VEQRQRRRQGRGRHQHFIGSWARLNCEDMPVIPAWLVRSNLNDPRTIPYLLVWKDERHDGEIKETVRLAHGGFSDLVELKRTDESTTVLRIVWRPLPCNGGRALFLLCPCCDTPRRFVYGWEWNWFSGRSTVVTRVSWRCRSCARLRYSSEGGYLRGGRGWLARFMGFDPGNLPRPEPWLPYVFTSPEEAAAAGVCAVNS
jgi:hypothetical protein